MWPSRHTSVSYVIWSARSSKSSPCQLGTSETVESGSVAGRSLAPASSGFRRAGGRADSMMPRTLLTSSPSSMLCTSFALTIGCTTSSTPALLVYMRYSFLLGIMAFVPLMVIGTMGTPARLAMEKGPFLKLIREPSGLRVPSGNTKIDVPALSVSTQVRNACIWDLRSSRSMVMVLAAFIACPTTGIFVIEAFDTNLKGLLRW
mmetsp:Transcript_56348/g.145054  ORF Transcript_56348/g.145054 Transcript_56348/m.145054 type:complete len:204 (-) Transcript_56348:610-1221(-)